jgi:hypothetical protein
MITCWSSVLFILKERRLFLRTHAAIFIVTRPDIQVLVVFVVKDGGPSCKGVML